MPICFNSRLFFKAKHPQTAALRGPFSDAVHPFRELELFRGQVAGDKIYFLPEAKSFHKHGEIGRIVIHHDHHLAMFKALNQDAIAVKGSKSLGTNHLVQATRPGPFKSAREQRFRDIIVLDAFEMIELSLLLAVILVVGLVFQHRKAGYIFSILAEQ